jgi:hypothetical protein
MLMANSFQKNHLLCQSDSSDAEMPDSARAKSHDFAKRSERRLDLVTEKSRLLLSVKQKDLLNHSSL